MKKIVGLMSSLLFLTGCTTISGIGQDNTPAPSALTAYHAKFSPQLVWTQKLNSQNNVSIFSFANGEIYWSRQFKENLVAGPAIANTMVIVGDNRAEVWGLSLNDGNVDWHTMLSDPINSPALIVNQNTYLQTIDGTVWSINNRDGSVNWKSANGIPTMILAGGTKPLLLGSTIIVGSSNGTLTSYVAQTGKIKWQITLAQPQGVSDVEKMIDVVADPQLSSGIIYVVTYQGNLAAVNGQSGHIIWQTPLSSYSGVAVSSEAVFVTDSQGIVWAFSRKTGKVLWKQDYLQYRKLTGPAVAGNTIVVADEEGYIHWLSQSSGETVARIKDSDASVMNTPVVQQNNVYVLSSSGRVSNYRF